MSESSQLLREYASGRTEEAFRRLVGCYVDFVYGVALRRVGGDPHLAQDVTQTVFSDLARKAPSMPQNVLLGGWLHRHTCFVSSKTVRADLRRREREQTAAQMNHLDNEAEPVWKQIAPILDDAIDQLGAADRAAIVLRFFEQRDLRAVGETLGTTEDAARKRVARALEKLRVLLGRRGVALSSTAVVGALTTGAAAGAPVGLAASVSSTVVAQTTAASGFALTLTKFIVMGKIKASITIGIVVAGVIIPLVLQYRSIQTLRKANTDLSAELARSRLEQQRFESLASAKLDQQLSGEQLAELLRLRSQATLLRRENRELTDQLARASKTASTPPAAAPAPSGTATPGAAMETFLSAVASGDTNLVGQLLAFRKDESISDDQLGELLSKQVRAAMRLKNGNVRILAQKELSPDLARIRLEIFDQNGQAHLGELDVIREGLEWRPALYVNRAEGSGSIQVRFLGPPTPEMGPINGSSGN